MSAENRVNSLDRVNNFDFLRFVAAAFLVWGHSYALSGHPPAPSLWGKPLHSMGLVIFFCISGYLVTESWLRIGTLATFFRNRVLRIFPALAVCVLLSACVLGPLVTRLTIGDYFGHTHFYQYLQNMALRIRYHLPGVFDGNPHPAINGSLWSLPVEFSCYIILALSGRVAGRHLRWATVFFACMTITSALYISAAKIPAIVIYGMNSNFFLAIVPYFFVGAVLRMFKTPAIFRYDLALAFAGTLFFVSSMQWTYTSILFGYLFTPYIVIALGTGATRHISDWGRRFGDLSYGMYLYSAPVQQLIVWFAGGSVALAIIVPGSLAGSMLVATLSWRYIEKPTLRLKQCGWTDFLAVAHNVRRALRRPAAA